MKHLVILILLLACVSSHASELSATNTVTLVTNVTEEFPTRAVMVPCPGSNNEFVHAIACWENVPVENPTTKTVVTTIKEIHTLNFQWRGKIRSVTEEVILSQTRQAFAKQDVWKDATK